MKKKSRKTSSRNSKIPLLLFSLIVLTLLALFVGAQINHRSNSKQQSSSIGNSVEKIAESVGKEVSKVVEKVTNTKTTHSHWINCSDLREVVLDGDDAYLACLGGVLKINAQTGEVLRQITVTDGLTDFITTDLALGGSKLYVGTQNGFSIVDLQSNAVKQVTTEDGLSNGANIKLALDGNFLWVATFDGLNRFNIQTGKITQYKSELARNTTQFNLADVIATDRAVYATLTAHAQSEGAVARYDKTTQTWKSYGPKSFLEKIDQYSRIDPSDLMFSNGKVFVKIADQVWEMDDGIDGVWQKSTQDLDALGQQTKISSPVISNEGGSYKLKHLEDRPINILSILALVDNDLFVFAEDGIWMLDLTSNTYHFITDLLQSENYGMPPSAELLDDGNLAIFYQSCGMACMEPEVFLFNITSRELSELNIPRAILNNFVRDEADARYKSYSLVKLQVAASEEDLFSIMSKINDDLVSTTYHQDGTWSADRVMGGEISGCGKPFYANKFYTLDEQGDIKWQTPTECDPYLSNGNVSFSMNKDGKVIERAGSNDLKVLTPNVAPARYSTWGTVNDPRTLAVVLANNILSIGTDRGLVLKNLTNQHWKLLSTKDGLISNEVRDLVMGNDLIGVLSFGGLSIVHLNMDF